MLPTAPSETKLQVRVWSCSLCMGECKMILLICIKHSSSQLSGIWLPQQLVLSAKRWNRLSRGWCWNLVQSRKSHTTFLRKSHRRHFVSVYSSPERYSCYRSGIQLISFVEVSSDNFPLKGWSGSYDTRVGRGQSENIVHSERESPERSVCCRFLRWPSLTLSLTLSSSYWTLFLCSWRKETRVSWVGWQPLHRDLGLAQRRKTGNHKVPTWSFLCLSSQSIL